MGSRRTRVALRRRAAIALAVWALALSLLALVAAIPSGPSAVLTVDDAFPAVGAVVHFNASGSQSHDAGNGRIISYDFAFGDGYATGTQASPLAEHAYAAAGSYVATLTVVDGRGQQASASVTLHPGSPPPPPVETPDVVPIQAQIDPSHPRVNDSINVTVVVLNRGGAAATGAVVAAYDRPENGTSHLVGRTNLTAPLGASISTSVTVGPFVASLAGNHTLRILVTNVTPIESGSAGRELDLNFTVSTAGPPLNHGAGPGFALSPLAIALGATAIAAGAGAALLFLRPKPPGPLEPPPASPPDRSPPPIWPP